MIIGRVFIVQKERASQRTGNQVAVCIIHSRLVTLYQYAIQSDMFMRYFSQHEQTCCDLAKKLLADDDITSLAIVQNVNRNKPNNEYYITDNQFDISCFSISGKLNYPADAIALVPVALKELGNPNNHFTLNLEGNTIPKITTQ